MPTPIRVPVRFPISISVWSDVVCPWCYIGKQRLRRAMATLAEDPAFPAVELLHLPFQLDPTASRRGEPVVDTYARKFGGPAGAAAVIDRVTAAAAADGLTMRLDRAVRANTADAHRLLWWALRHGGAAVQDRLDDELMRAYFCDGEDLGDPAVLVARAAACGLDPEGAGRLLAADEGVEALAIGLQQAAASGVTAVPTYVLDGRWSIPGAQDPDVFVGALRRVA